MAECGVAVIIFLFTGWGFHEFHLTVGLYIYRSITIAVSSSS